MLIAPLFGMSFSLKISPTELPFPAAILLPCTSRTASEIAVFVFSSNSVVRAEGDHRKPSVVSLDHAP